MSLDKSKVDAELGHKVFQYLSEKGVETPRFENGLSESEKMKVIASSF